MFVKHRITTHILQHFLQSDEQLRGIVRSDEIYAVMTPASPSFGMLPTQSRDRLAVFARGDLNLLLATSVAEEGTEIPVANVVLRFDPIQNPMSLVQSRGAREAGRQRVSCDARRGEREKGTWGVGRGSDGEYRNLGVS